MIKKEVTASMVEQGQPPRTGGGVFPVSHSISSPAALLKHVRQTYPIDPPSACELLHPGPNDTYLLASDRQRYILRVYGADWRSPAEIQYELDLLAHLAGKGVTVALPIANRQGALSGSWPAPEGVRQIVLFEYARGTPLSWSNLAHCQLAGQVVALIHAAADDFDSDQPRTPLDLTALTEVPLQRIQPFLATRARDREFLDDLVARLRARAQTAIGNGLDWGVCHGDVSSGNIFVTPAGGWTAIDFDLCAPGWRAFDLVPPSRIAWYEKRREIWEAFLRGYRLARPLNEPDLEAVSVFHALSRLWSLGMRAGIVGLRGTAAMTSYLDSYLAFFREWETAEQGGK